MLFVAAHAAQTVDRHALSWAIQAHLGAQCFFLCSAAHALLRLVGHGLGVGGYLPGRLEAPLHLRGFHGLDLLERLGAHVKQCGHSVDGASKMAPLAPFGLRHCTLGGFAFLLDAREQAALCRSDFVWMHTGCAFTFSGGLAVKETHLI